MKLKLEYCERRKSYAARHEGVTLVLMREYESQASTDLAEYAIVTRLGNHPRGFLIAPVLPNHQLVKHEGFTMSGSMCRTLSWSTEIVPFRRNGTAITPGRLAGLLHIANHVDAREPVLPGTIYVERNAGGMAKAYGFDTLIEVQRNLNFSDKVAAQRNAGEHRLVSSY